MLGQKLMSLLSLVVLASLSSAASSQKADLKPADAAEWKSISYAGLTPKAEWFVYLIEPYSAMTQSAASSAETLIVARRLRDGTELRRTAGTPGTAGRLSFSGTRAQVAYIESRSGASAAVLWDLNANKEFRIPGGIEYQFVGSNRDKLLVLSSHGNDTRKLSLHGPQGEMLAQYPDVVAYAPNNDGTRVAWLTSSTVYMATIDAHKPQQLRADDLKGFPSGHEFKAGLLFNDALGGVFVRTGPREEGLKSAGEPDVLLWHSRADRLPRQALREALEPREGWGFVNLISSRFTPLTDDARFQLELPASGRYVLGFDAHKYGWMNPRSAGTALQTRDYYLVDVTSGKRKPLALGLRVDTRFEGGPKLSPDGRFVVYKDNEGDYIAFNVATNEAVNQTASLPVRFYLPENNPETGRVLKDVPAESASYGVQGWTRDGKSVLVSDWHDIWLLPLRAGTPRNLTGNGRQNDLNYRISPMSLAADQTVDPAGRIFYDAVDYRSGRNGLLLSENLKASPRALRWVDAATMYLRAKDTEVFIVRQESASESPNYFVLNAAWEPSIQLTDINPQQARYRWPPAPRYLTYKTVKGDTRHAVLYLPIDYTPGTRYPTMVYIYRQVSGKLHVYDPFAVDRLPWLQRGYAVLHPDIIPRVNEAGRAALEAVSAAVDAGASIGVVDKERLAITGHSYGAWETLYIVAHSNLFKAAVANAGMSNLISHAGALYSGEVPVGLAQEHDQPFLAGPLWTEWDAYVENSPLFRAQHIRTPLLLLHGARDDVVPFSQSLELFNALRRLGNPNVVLVEYVGQSHVLEGAANLDAEQKTVAFVDHILTGAAAPGWWSNTDVVSETLESATASE